MALVVAWAEESAASAAASAAGSAAAAAAGVARAAVAAAGVAAGVAAGAATAVARGSGTNRPHSKLQRTRWPCFRCQSRKKDHRIGCGSGCDRG